MADYEVVNTSTIAPEKGVVCWDIDGEEIRESSESGRSRSNTSYFS